MKVLIAINNDAISEAIGNYYRKEYKENLEIKNVYYFKALLEEVKVNKYDRIIIHEELEPFTTTNQEVIDNFLFETIDKISDESHGTTIIFICSDRRKRDDRLIKRLFNIGIYNMLIGEDRTIEEVVKLINTPRSKKDAKSYIDYDLDEDVYRKDEEVNEAELTRILMAYENAGDDEDEYVRIFERIAEQYTDIQLKVISAFLPDRVKRVLAQRCEKYRQIINVSVPLETARPDIDSFEFDEEKSIYRRGYKTHDKSRSDNFDKVESNINFRQPQRSLTVPSTASDPLSRVHKVTEVIEKEVVREVYETPKDYRKIVCFVGAHKVGTTFVINAIARYLTKRGVKTAIIDLTRNKDTYFIYALRSNSMQEIGAQSLSLLAKGKDNPLEVERISIYTGIPGQIFKENVDYIKMLEIVRNNHTVILIDCDFDTPLEIFKLSHNIYIVQDMDILNLQPITSFLRELKYRGINLEKARVIINKHIKCELPAKKIIEGISYYSNPERTIYDELFVKAITYYILPFDEHNYKKYIEGLYNDKNNYNAFTEDFKEALEHVVASIYPVGPSRSRVRDLRSIFDSIKNMISLKKGSTTNDSGFKKYTV